MPQWPGSSRPLLLLAGFGPRVPTVARTRGIGDNRFNKKGRRRMRALLALALGLIALPALADEDIVLRGMGSFHIGGRIAEVSGKPITEIQRVPGGPMSKLDRNGQFMVE